MAKSTSAAGGLQDDDSFDPFNNPDDAATVDWLKGRAHAMYSADLIKYDYTEFIQFAMDMEGVEEWEAEIIAQFLMDDYGVELTHLTANGGE